MDGSIHMFARSKNNSVNMHLERDESDTWIPEMHGPRGLTFCHACPGNELVGSLAFQPNCCCDLHIPLRLSAGLFA